MHARMRIHQLLLRLITNWHISCNAGHMWGTRMMLNTFIVILGAWLLADFISGVAHWAQDRILVPSKNNFKNKIIMDNVLHHTKPAEMLKFSLLENIRIAIFVMWPIALILYLMGSPTVIWLAFFFVAFGNGVHWFSHQRRVNFLVRFLQRIGLFTSFSHHRQHHQSAGKLVDRHNAKIKFCVMTNWVNPLLDRIQFFRFLEMAFGKRGNV